MSIISDQGYFYPSSASPANQLESLSLPVICRRSFFAVSVISLRHYACFCHEKRPHNPILTCDSIRRTLLKLLKLLDLDICARHDCHNLRCVRCGDFPYEWV